jgi:hypothetical protein
MELTEGILKSIESSIMQNYNNESFIVKYKGKVMNDTYLKCVFKTEGAAKTFITRFVTDIFKHGGYWQSCKSNIKNHIGYDVDYTGTQKMTSHYKYMSDWDKPESKKMIKDIGLELLKQGIITIEKVEKTVLNGKM